MTTTDTRTLDLFVLRASDDPVKTDLELICSGCEFHLCDAEDGDSLALLADCAIAHDCTTAYDPLIEKAKDKAGESGETAGTRAGNSFFDGNTSNETYARVLAGIDDGDPAVLNEIPSLDLSGQWADGPNATDIAMDAVEAAGGEFQTLDDSPHYDWPAIRDEIVDAYEQAYNSAVQHEVERVCRYHLDD